MIGGPQAAGTFNGGEGGEEEENYAKGKKRENKEGRILWKQKIKNIYSNQQETREKGSKPLQCNYMEIKNEKTKNKYR